MQAADLYIQTYKDSNANARPGEDGEGGSKGKGEQSPASSAPPPTSIAADAIAAAREKVQSMIDERPILEPVDASAAASMFLSTLGAGASGDGKSNLDGGRDRDHNNNHNLRDDLRAPARGGRGGENINEEREHPPPPVPAPPPPPVAPKPAAAQPPVSRPAIRKRPLTTAFGDEEEEVDEGEKKARKLIPIHYTTEELQGVLQEQPGSAAVQASNPVEDRKKRLLAAVPKDKDVLFAYPVKWEALDGAPPTVKSKLSGWINKKIKELVGDDEDGAGFADFIVSEVNAHRSASQLLGNLEGVLDEDAEPFVIQLFKVCCCFFLPSLSLSLNLHVYIYIYILSTRTH